MLGGIPQAETEETPYSGSLKSAIHNWLEWSAVRLLVHINCWPSGEKTGSTSADG